MDATVKRRIPWRAALANLVLAPLGHMYVGRLGRGVALGLLALGSAFLLLGTVGLRANAATAAALLSLAFVAGKVLLPLDAWLIARREGAAYRLRPYNRWYAYGAMALLTFIALEFASSLMRAYVVQSYRIPSSAMVPTLRIGDHVMADKRAYLADGPRRFDVVVFEYPEDPEKTFVKRVVGLPGEKVEIRDRKVWVDGVALDESHAHFENAGAINSPRDALPPVTLAEGEYFLLGDNRDRSYDSRFWGAVKRDKIFGRVTTIYFPFDRFGAVE